MPYRLLDSAIAGWAALSGLIAVSGQAIQDALPPIIPGTEYLGEGTLIAGLLLFLWKAGARIGPFVVEHSSKGGARLLKFLEDKDAKDRAALEAFGARVESSVDRLSSAVETTAREQRAAIETLADEIRNNAPRRRPARGRQE